MSKMLPEKKDRKIALVVIDVQRKFTGGSIKEQGNQATIENINKVTAMFHEKDRPVIFVYYDGPCECSAYSKDDGDEYLHGIMSDPRDIIVHKDRMNSFVGSRLAEVIKECGCDSILLAGMVTQFCVIGTYYGAFEHNISPYLLRGGTIATDEKYDEAAYVLCKTFTMEDVKDNLWETKIPESIKMFGSEHCRCGVADK